jgi:hypothetical protein
MSSEYKNSAFLTDLIEYLNGTRLGKKIDKNGGTLASKKRFYAATLELDVSKLNASEGWPQQATEKSERFWIPEPEGIKYPGTGFYVYDESIKEKLKNYPGKKQFANASMGAHQINAFLSQQKTATKYFADDFFIKYLLQTYSNIKVYTKGEHARHDLPIPDFCKYKRSVNPDKETVAKQDKFIAGDLGVMNDIDVPGWLGVLSKDNFDKYDVFFRGRILPIFVGGRWNSKKSTRDSKVNLQRDFRKHLGAKKVERWTTNERRLFLLMSGKYYEKNDLAFLNINDAANSGIYNDISQDVRKFWKDTYAAVAALEDQVKKTSVVDKTLESLLGEKPSLQLFAKYITHGAPSDLDFAKKVNSYFYFDSPNQIKIRPAFMLNCYPTNQTRLTLVIPDYQSQKAAYRQAEYAQRDAPGKLQILKDMYNKDDSVLGKKGSYQYDFPQGGTNKFKAFNANNLLFNDKVIELETAGVPISPANLKDIVNRSKAPTTSPQDKFNLDGNIIVSADPYASAVEAYKNLEGPPIGNYFKIAKGNTILDFQPSKYIEKLKTALSTAVANELPDGVKTSYFQSDELIKTLYAPLEKATQVVSSEYARLNERQRLFKEKTKNGESAENIAKSLLLTQDITAQEDISLQLWIDSVNAAAAKIAYWVEYAISNTTIAVRWFTVQSLVAAKKSRDEVAKILADTNLVKGKPSDQAKRPFQIELKPPPSGVPSKNLLDADEAKKRLRERRRNIDQCVLSANMSKLAKAHDDLIRYEQRGKAWWRSGIHKKEIYGGRFYCLQENNGQHSSITNYLTAPKANKIKSFLDMTPDIQSALTPKIRLYRIFKDASENDIETEFVFENFVSTNEISTLQSSTAIQKGRGCGIKSFSFSYEGGTPATAKKDINAELVLFFQSFNELTRKRKSGENSYKYIDLLLYPNNREGTSPSKNIHPNQYNPTDFRIRADVGWNKREDEAFKEMLLKHANLENKKDDESLSDFGDKIVTKFNQGLELINKSFLLNMVDHDIDFKNDGSLEIKISYAAYIESALRSAKINALSTPGIEKYYRQQTKKIRDLITNGNCSIRQINTLKKQQAATRTNYIKAAQGSIVKRLIDRGLQRRVVFNKKDIDEYLKEFATTPPRLKQNFAKDGVIAQNAKKKEVEVSFFFLGDILHTAMDCLFETDSVIGENWNPKTDKTKNYTKRVKELKNFIPLLGSFIYSDFNLEEDAARSINLAQIPISTKFFNEWMINNVIKNERTVYPLMNFVRDLAGAVVDLIVDACINQQIDVSLMFQTAQIRAVGKSNEKDYLNYGVAKIDNKKSTSAIRSVNQLHKKGYLPFKTGGSNSKGVPYKIRRFFDYTLVYAVSPTQTAGHQGTGVRFRDEGKGIYHFQIGSHKGLLKNVKFSKTDMAYLREARFFNQGNYGLLQLGAVYNVTLELFGNTLFYPGMELFIDPRGFGGSDWNPTQSGSRRSVANALGIGGYHTVVKVNSQISVSGFTTTIDALFQYSGAPEDRGNAIDGKADKRDAPQEPSESDNRGKRSRKCVDTLNSSTQRQIRSEKVEEKRKS